MNQLHLLVMVVSFAWTALQEYSATPQGAQELADIEAILTAIENPGNTTPSPTGTSASTPSASTSQIIRK